MNARRIAALALTLMMAVSFMPILGGVYAANDASEVTFDNEAQFSELSVGTMAKASTKTSAATKGWCTVTVNKKAGTATVKGELTNDFFFGVLVDNDVVWEGNANTKTINTTINMKDYSIGYHTIYVGAFNHWNNTGTPFKIQTHVYRGIFERPYNSASSYDVYSKYFNFNNGVNYRVGLDLYMEYKVKGAKNWTMSGKMNTPVANYKFTKLKANKKYQTRLFFGKWIEYNGKSYLFRSTDTGNGSGIVNIKTGKAKKPRIKLVKVKAIKVKKRTGIRYGYYTGLPLGKYRYYSYKIKVTVKLKKKPGSKGIVINGKKFKGNKKKYTFTMGPYTNFTKPKGKKFTVYAYTYENAKTYGGYSPMFKKTVRVK